MTNTINHPAHYQGCSGLTRHIAELLIPFEASALLEQECIEVIERYNYGFHIGNTLKYLWRCGQKADPIEDLQKAKWYLERYQQSRGPWHNEAIEAIEALIQQICKGCANEPEQGDRTQLDIFGGESA
jgi:hypothetical protein